MTTTRRARHPHQQGRRKVARDLAVGLALLSGVAGATWGLLGLPANYLLHTAALYALLAALIVRHLPACSAGPGLGAANLVTLGRATLVLPVGALVVQLLVHREAGYWWVIALGTTAMVLDGVDGWVARRSRTTSAFGARFDMELDAFLMLALSFLVWQSGKIGAWVILIGAMRYLFVGTGAVWPPLRSELPASQRRRVACVVQGVALLVCLGPIVSPQLAAMLALGALALLTFSFAVDVRWLVRAAVARSRGR